jgi:redox-sensitive bicupin YhaK (pirin superfamily)
VDGVTGPVSDLYAEPSYLDVSVEANRTFQFPVNSMHTVFAYVFEGSGIFNPEEEIVTSKGGFVHFGEGDFISIKAGSGGVRFLFISGKPLHEPVAWYGPIVMNTEEELQTAFTELNDGTFIKKV